MIVNRKLTELEIWCDNVLRRSDCVILFSQSSVPTPRKSLELGTAFTSHTIFAGVGVICAGYSGQPPISEIGSAQRLDGGWNEHPVSPSRSCC